MGRRGLIKDVNVTRVTGYFPRGGGLIKDVNVTRVTEYFPRGGAY